MKIVDLSDGGASLEFELDEGEAVLGALRSLGATVVEQAMLFDRLLVDGAKILGVSEMGDSYLLATSDDGRRVLEQICDLAARPAESRLTTTRRAS